ncbi:MAG: VWA domain-containing protein [Terracidiphilus sp.]
MKLGLTAIALAALLSLSPNSHLSLSMTAAAQQQQPAVPDAPTPQAPKPLASDVNGPITPGQGAGETPTGPNSSSNLPGQQPAPASQPASSQPPTNQSKDTVQTAPPETPAAGEGVEKATSLIRVHVNFVEVPVTVKDSKGKLVPGLTYRDFKVFENDTREPIAFFTTDSFPLSIAFVIDQSLTTDVMNKVNNSLGAIQGALTPYDEIEVFSYNNGAQNRSGGFTGAQSARVPFVLSMAKAAGEEMLVPVNDGPMAGCNVRQNGNCVDPNLQPGRSAGGSTFMTIPKEIHTLNDAILAAAKELSTRPKGRRRIIYVISDGKEYGSKATYKEVLRYLETNKIAVYGTLVGDSARWGEGYVSRVHLPFSMYDNILARYILATGGEPDAERGLDGIEKSYARIAEEARNQYTLGYYSHQPVIDGKFRKIEVRLERTGMEVVAKQGYYPSAEDMR